MEIEFENHIGGLCADIVVASVRRSKAFAFYHAKSTARLSKASFVLLI